MLAKKLMSVKKGGGGPIEYIGSLTTSWWDEDGWNSSGDMDVLSIAEVGDLIVVAFSFDASADSSWSWIGMDITDISDNTSSTLPGAYVGYHIIESGDTNPYPTGVTSDYWDGFTAVVSVFRNVNSFVGSSHASGNGLPNPPSLTATGGLWIATGHLDDDEVASDWTLGNYTFAGQINFFQSVGSTTAIFYRIEDLTSDNPAAFSGSGSDAWRATTICFN